MRKFAAALAAGLTGLAAMAAPAGAIDLVEAWHAAQQNDPDYAAARAARDAGSTRRAQGNSLWLPEVQATGSVGRASASTQASGAHFSAPGLGASNGVDFSTSVTDGNASSVALTARQPLWSGERLARWRGLRLGADAADLQWDAARQGLMLQVAEQYFGVVIARETLRVAREQEGATLEALEQARERYRLGDTPITDSHEAEERAHAMRAQAISAESDLAVREAAFSGSTGVEASRLALRRPAVEPMVPVTGALEDWIARARANSPELRLQATRVAMAEQDVARHRALSSPSLDVVARAGRDHLSGTGDFGPAGNTARGAMLGVQLSVPLFTGGYRSAKHDEALDLADQARSEQEAARRRVALQARSAWIALTAGAERVEALAAGQRASALRLDATRLGRENGDRSTLDLLRAQSDAAQSELGLLQARVNLILDRLRLAAVAGALDEDTLRAASASLAP